MSRQALWTIVVVLVVLGGAVWFFNNFERVPDKEWTGYQGEARRNGFLAAERLLDRMGLRVRHLKTPIELRELPANGTLILPARRNALAPAERERLLEWVEAGSLVVENENHRLPDPILDALGVEREPVKAPGQSRATEARLPHSADALKVSLASGQTLVAPEGAFRVQDRTVTQLVHFKRGRGQVTALNDFGFMRNAGVGQNDHAEFDWQLVRFLPGTAAVFVFDNPQKLSLFEWLVDNAWAVLASGALLLAAWLWRIAPRFGPMAPDPEPVRRRLLDHLRASGRFQWSAGGAATLAEAAREAALRRSPAPRPISPRSLGRAARAARRELRPAGRGRRTRAAAGERHPAGGVRQRDARVPAHPRAARAALEESTREHR
jgi:hypothetical protein